MSREDRRLNTGPRTRSFPSNSTRATPLRSQGRLQLGSVSTSVWVSAAVCLRTAPESLTHIYIATKFSHEEQTRVHLHQSRGHSHFFKWSKGGQEKNCLWTEESSVGTAIGVFNLPKQNMCFQDVIRDYCSHSKHFMDVNCWLVNRALSWEVSTPLSSKQPSGRSAGPASQSFFTVEGLLSLGTDSLSKISHHWCAPLGSG